jgi:hypothetical protein
MKRSSAKRTVGWTSALAFCSLLGFAPQAAAACSDFNGDGKNDLAIGVPGNRVGDVNNAGAVHILYGRPNSLVGLSEIDDQLWTQRGVLVGNLYEQDLVGTPEEGDGFGSGLATGDFDGDGFCDLAIGVPAENLRVNGVTIRDAGVVTVLYGSLTGLSNDRSQVWTQSGVLTDAGFIQDIVERPDADDAFGSVLVAGNFDGDTRNGRPVDDLAIGIPSEDIAGVGLVDCGSAGGDGPGGSRTGLLCPAPDIVNAGAVQIIYGSRSGLASSGNQLWTQDGMWTERDGYSHDIQGMAEEEDFFGLSLAVGNFNDDTRAGSPIEDLAIGVPRETLGGPLDGKVYAGAVHVLNGSTDGLADASNQLWTQDAIGNDQSEQWDRFGWSLAAGNFDDDGGDDLAIGVPNERTRRITPGGTQLDERGAVVVLYSADRGRLASDNTIIFTASSTAGVPIVQMDESYGLVLVAGDFDGNGSDDLAIGDPRRDAAAATGAGAVHVMYGATAGRSLRLSTQGSQLWTQDSASIHGLCEQDDRFGSALAAADFNGDGRSDLASGVPLENVGEPNGGAVNVIYGSNAGLAAAGNQLWHQAVEGVYGDPTLDDRFGFALGGGSR